MDMVAKNNLSKKYIYNGDEKTARKALQINR